MTESTSAVSNNMARSISPNELFALAVNMEKRTTEMVERAKAKEPLTEEELDDVVESLMHLTPIDTSAQTEWKSLREVLKEIAHISHKDWKVTTANAQRLLPFLIPDDEEGFPGSLSQGRFQRILTEGNWGGAVKNVSSPKAAPWAVLVTGVNGIRKTTSLYQSWFGTLLEEALVPPASWEGEPVFTANDLPTGRNSFFRQLDHMITTLCNKDFAILYALTSKLLTASDSSGEPTTEIIQAYSNLKAALFTRYRTLSELFGVLLLQQAQKVPINCLLETSGRDVAMFHYVDIVFPSTYRKLVLHFKINDLTEAQASVDRRMVHEIKIGTKAIEANPENKEEPIDIQKVIFANEGGPYGSEVLHGVQQASSAVWETVVDGSAGVGGDWFKATIQINAHATEPWTAQAIKPDGTLGTVFQFEKR